MAFSIKTGLAILASCALVGCRSAPVSNGGGGASPATVTAAALPPASVLTGEPDSRPLGPDSVAPVDFSEEIPTAAEPPRLEPLSSAGDDDATEPPAESPGEGESWTVEDCLGMALERHPSLSAAAARMDAADGRRWQAGRYPNPVVGYHAMQMGNQGTAGQQGMFLRQRIVTGGKLRLDEQLADLDWRRANQVLHIAEFQVLRDVRVRFDETLIAQRRLEIARELADISERLESSIQTLVDARLRSENDLLQAKLQADEARIVFDNARHELTEAKRRLAAVIGWPALQIESVRGDLEAEVDDVAFEVALHRLASSSPQLQAARTRAERASLAIERAKREPIPDFDVTVSVRRDNITRDDVANVQVGVPLPVFDANQGDIRAAEAEWIAARDEAARLELRLHDRLAVAHRRFANARQQVARYRESMLPNASRSLQIVAKGYEENQVEYLALLTAQRTYFEINLAYLSALRQLRESAASLENFLLQGSLEGDR